MRWGTCDYKIHSMNRCRLPILQTPSLCVSEQLVEGVLQVLCGMLVVLLHYTLKLHSSHHTRARYVSSRHQRS
jgi:hypothetical protein